MEITHIIAGLIVLLVLIYFQSRNVFAFARRGEDYLQSLIDSPEQYNNDPDVLRALKVRDMPRLVEFISVEPKLHKIMLVAMIVNVVGIFYPTDALFGMWVGWVLLLLLTIVNADAILTSLVLQRNKRVVSQLCNGYYNIMRQYAQEEQRYINMADSINAAFRELDKNIKKIKDEVDTDGKDE